MRPKAELGREFETPSRAEGWMGSDGEVGEESEAVGRVNKTFKLGVNGI